MNICKFLIPNLLWYIVKNCILDICIKCNKTWVIPTTKYNPEGKLSFICTKCKKDEQKQQEPPAKRQHGTNTGGKQVQPSKEIVALEDISRYQHHTNPEYEYLLEVSDDISDQFATIIEEAFGINETKRRKFKDLKTAENSFIRKFLYVKNKENIFEFHKPKSLWKIGDEGSSTEDEIKIEFKITFDDIMSLIKKRPITTGVVDFAMDCFNFYTHHDVAKVDIPSHVFGKTDCLNKIVPSETNFPAIKKFYDTSITKLQQVEINNLSVILKEWFYASDKGFITRVLDKYDAKKLLINEFATIQKCPNGDYALFICRIDETSNIPGRSIVTSYDFNMSNPNFVDQHRT